MRSDFMTPPLPQVRPWCKIMRPPPPHTLLGDPPNPPTPKKNERPLKLTPVDYHCVSEGRVHFWGRSILSVQYPQFIHVPPYICYGGGLVYMLKIAACDCTPRKPRSPGYLIIRFPYQVQSADRETMTRTVHSQ